MDKDTRNRLQRATQAARALIEDEYGEQLEGTFDLRLDGTIPSEPGDHLDRHQRVMWKKLVAAIGHLEAGGEKKPEAVQAYLREAAFTTLNRFVALKTLEARGLALESVTEGDQSSGFKEFTGLAPGLVQLPDHGYRLYIESLFDEIGREVRVLFDRRDPASLLWPRRQVLQDLFEILNAPELASVWIEDETIGWVYQYFNGEDERKQMREESQAPRNSRELAVRNQFFTPRYVVQFLVDNTLGRTWFEMMRGETSLKGLDYLVRCQHEVFLDEGETLPEEPEGVNFGQTPEHPVPVPFRAKKDPRDLKILDPACGSGHFLLYTFDLLLTIYEEAWQDEAAAPSEQNGATLRSDIPELDALRAAAPELVLRHNLHGIDIDPRAAQIAALALWLRAQRAFQAADLSRTQRPAIAKTNIVVAEPMPGEADLREAFVATLDPKLGKLVERVFDRMSLAGEAGYLLRIAEQIEESTRQIYGGVGGLFEAPEESEWAQAARDLRTALETFATSPGTDRDFTRQLFADDAARGLGFIDVCSQRYDTILMNPPFGLGSAGVNSLIEVDYPASKRELSCAFLERARALVVDEGSIGQIGTRTPLFLRSYRKWREETLDSGKGVAALVDLGRGVLDATVESVAFVLAHHQTRPGTFFQAWEGGMVRSGAGELLRSTIAGRSELPTYTPPAGVFARLPNAPLAYWAHPELLKTYSRFGGFEEEGRDASSGASTNDDFRFLRLWCEVSIDCLGASTEDSRTGKHWIPLAKGGEYSPYYRNLELVVNWRNDGQECKSYIADYRGQRGWGYHWTAALNGHGSYFRPGVTWSRRTSTWISGRVLPAGCIFGDKGPAAFLPSPSEEELFGVVAWLNSSAVGALIALSVGKEGSQGTAGSNSYEVGVVERLPFPGCDALREASRLAQEAYRLRRDLSLNDELSRLYSGPLVSGSAQRSALAARELQERVDLEVGKALGLGADTVAELARGSRIDALDPSDPFESPFKGGGDQSLACIQWAVGSVFGRWATQCPHEAPDLPTPFDPLPSRPPAMDQGREAEARTEDIAVDDEGGVLDLAPMIAGYLEPLQLEGGAGRALRSVLRTSFWSYHLSCYSRSRRRAPIYWQLATPSASYSAWLYYHRFTRDTLFRMLNDHVAPKAQHEERKLTSLTQDAGPNPTASQRKEIDGQETFVGELRAFRDEVARVAPLWNPNLNDGVILNFAPLWRLVPQHKPWQKECKKAWDKLCKGGYDWAHLAMHLWSERVVPKCAKDRSLAIAHGLEEVFWCEDEDGKWQPKKVSDEEVAGLVAERTSPAVKAALKSLLEAPAPAARRGRAPRRKKTATTRRAKTTATSTTPAEPREPAPRRTTSTRTVDPATLDQILLAIATLGDNAAKSDILDTADLSASQWTPAINALLADGSVTKTGVKRGTRYHLAQNPR